jgi:hypothetical protein
VCISKGVLSVIPSSITEVQAANESDFVVYDDKLLVVGLYTVLVSYDLRWIQFPYPIEGHVSGVFQNVMVRMSHQLDIFMSLFTLRNEIHYDFLSVLAVACERGSNLNEL